MFMKNISVTKHEVVAVAGEKTAIPCDCTPTSSHPGKQDHAADDGYGDGDSDGNSAKYYSSWFSEDKPVLILWYKDQGKLPIYRYGAQLT